MKTIKFENITYKETKYKHYYVSECGKIISTKIKGGQGNINEDNPRHHSIKKDKDGYFEVCLSFVESGKQKRKYVRLHRLIYETWVGKILDTIDHIDKDKTNNKVSNLRDISRSLNSSIAKKKSRTFILKYSNGESKKLSFDSFSALVEFLPISESSIRKRMKREIFGVCDVVKIDECND